MLITFKKLGFLRIRPLALCLGGLLASIRWLLASGRCTGVHTVSRTVVIVDEATFASSSLLNDGYSVGGCCCCSSNCWVVSPSDPVVVLKWLRFLRYRRPSSVRIEYDITSVWSSTTAFFHLRYPGGRNLTTCPLSRGFSSFAPRS